MEENVIYKDVVNFPGYRVGSDGSVWSRRSLNGRGPLANEWRKLAIMTPPSKKGYAKVSFYRSGKIVVMPVHVAVLEAFVGPCPEGMQACHAPDWCRSNNAISNLRWDTPKGNQKDRRLHGTDPRGENNAAAKLTNEQVVEVRKRYASIHTGRKLANGLLAKISVEFGITKGQILRIVQNKNWKHLEQGV